MKRSQAFLRLASLFCVLALTAVLSTGCSGDDKKKNESKSAEAAVSSEITAVTEPGGASAEISAPAEDKRITAPEESSSEPSADFSSRSEVSVDASQKAAEASDLIAQIAGPKQAKIIADAKELQETLGCSQKDLADMLKDGYGYTEEEAKFGAEHCDADWNQAAVTTSKDYLEIFSYSRKELIEQLTEIEQFTPEQAEYGADHCGADWKELAVKRTKELMEMKKESRAEYLDFLLYVGFTKEEAEYGLTKAGL